MRNILLIFLVALHGFVASAHADEAQSLQASLSLSELPPSLMGRAVDGMQNTLDQALELMGIRYKRGGNSPETGFDCSGFVRHVFNQSLGLSLPRSALAISQAAERIDKQELQPGDLVFFNTMRRAFSHVGIYLGEGQFVHAPRAGGRVRIENMGDRYWKRRFDGARRIQL
ncbi:MAG: C40 family peptidase [Gammaproteobacteria bacterium]|nr:NlpC/P60 family protein [Rhodocyclaceae bacterium]MBU3910255.1 C40 family peptidase [Gammaproteobacteria bacterium]MBU3989450.1 C40 family peptidase [Gammaproteobacteria bacterium]MBU4005425.1 C40 family peptidase [Gammaproteobacteria bacterium]MBU4022717.1 C40 family peptidase [Gammaproteobacteria bacterium]